MYVARGRRTGPKKLWSRRTPQETTFSTGCTKYSVQPPDIHASLFLFLHGVIRTVRALLVQYRKATFPVGKIPKRRGGETLPHRQSFLYDTSRVLRFDAPRNIARCNVIFKFCIPPSYLTGFKGSDKESLSRRNSLPSTSLETLPHRSAAGKAPESSLRMDRQLAWLLEPISPFPPGFAPARLSVGLPAVVVGRVGSTIGLMLRTRVWSETITCHGDVRSVGKENWCIGL